MLPCIRRRAQKSRPRLIAPGSGDLVVGIVAARVHRPHAMATCVESGHLPADVTIIKVFGVATSHTGFADLQWLPAAAPKHRSHLEVAEVRSLDALRD